MLSGSALEALGCPLGLALPVCAQEAAPEGCSAHGLELSGAKVKTSVCVFLIDQMRTGPFSVSEMTLSRHLVTFRCSCA